VSTRAANCPIGAKADAAAPAADGAAVPLHPQPSHRDGAILCVAGGLGDHVQAAALLRALRARRGLPHARLVGALDNTALRLNSVLLPVGSSSDDEPLILGVAELPFETRVAELASRFAPVVEQHRPKAVIVFNGSDVAWACAEVAHLYDVPVVHVGAGQRTESRASAADVSRIATDRLSDLLFPSEVAFEQCLLKEGVPASRIRCVGSLSMDALRGAMVPYGDRGQGPTMRLVPPHFLADRHGFGVLWLSAPANITDRRRLQNLMVLAAAVSRDLPLVWPVGNVVRKLSKSFGLRRVIAGERIVCLPAQPHFAAVDLMRNATCLLTDSWRMQDEALALGVPCLMLGDDAKRVGRDGESAATYVGCSSVTATRAVWNVAYSGRRTPTLPFAWDGKAAERIADVLDRAAQGWRVTGNAVRSP
jgi:UDP-N-acetylglucosamine 2-epimerase